MEGMGWHGMGSIVSHLEESFLHCRRLIAVLGDVVHHIHCIHAMRYDTM